MRVPTLLRLNSSRERDRECARGRFQFIRIQGECKSMNYLNHRIRKVVTAVVAPILLSVYSTSASPQWYSWGVCTPSVATGSAPPPSACDDPCPTGTCGAACNTITYSNASCSGDKPACGWEFATAQKTAVCRQCICNQDPVDPRCVSTGTIFRTGSIDFWDCFN